jgi:hypothetical protein
MPATTNDRDAAIKRIKTALQRRSGKTWSVTGGRGTAWGWITIDAPPRRRTWRWLQTSTPEPPVVGAIYRGVNGVTPCHLVRDGAEDQIHSVDDDPWAREAMETGQTLHFDWEVEDPTYDFGHTSPADRLELATLLGIETAHPQGVSIPAGGDYREEYLARAEGRPVTVYGKQYWD